MGKKAFQRYRADVAKELLSIADILESEGICPDVGPIRSAANQCLECGGNVWRYDFSNVILRLSSTAQSFPRSLNDLSCRLNVRVAGTCDCAVLGDPLTDLAVNIIIEGMSMVDGRKHIQCWHFDRHISSLTDEPATCAHPRYHFQFGGRSMEAYAEQLGINCFESVLLLDSPRIAHAPLDGVLIIDFVLSNFVGEKWQKLRSGRVYSAIVAASQKRNWRPFVSALNCWACSSEAKVWTPIDVWPHLLVSAPSTISGAKI